jgi:uncharacterized protein DUF4440
MANPEPGFQPGSPAEEELVRLNEEIAEKERLGDTSCFERTLANNLIFRRANGKIENKVGFLKSLETVHTNPYELLEASVEYVTVDQQTAVVYVSVKSKRKNNERPGEYENVRMFEQQEGTWKLVTWTNRKVRDL